MDLYFLNKARRSDGNPHRPIWSKTHVLMATWRVNVFQGVEWRALMETWRF
ncbi:hypothetical protein [Burkholderia sp. F1]|uniref:hypothetical protein n=1 Tax=Burkholderia sp. F1 TaxID=3366817 RepID=UPI003D747C20